MGQSQIASSVMSRLRVGRVRAVTAILRAAGVSAAVLMATDANAGLIGTELTLTAEAELTATSPLIEFSFPHVVTVSATSVEFPDVASLFDPNSPTLPGFAHSLVNVAIDVGDNFITYDFHNAGFGVFATGFKNGDLFEFDSQALATITGASVDKKLTTLGLVDSDLTFIGNQLFVNVEGLPFNPNSFIKIDLNVEGGPGAVPEPSSLVLAILCALGTGLYWLARRSRSAINPIATRQSPRLPAGHDLLSRACKT
jgi:hypothetical protein